MKNKKFYVTTPIYYVTAKPHLGSLYSTVLADVAARWAKLQGKKTFFLTGTDEHGQKIAQAAEKVGKKPQEFVDSFIPAYKTIWQEYDIDYSAFIRTTDEHHKKAVQECVTKLLQKGDIYKSHYSGWYCTPCETFVTGAEEVAETGPACPTCGRETVRVSEESYFFKLSAYQDKLLDFYTNNPNFVTPKERIKEVVSFVKSGLQDLSISRTTISWGVPFSQDSEHVVYVWIDALLNYLSGIGYGQQDKEQEFNYWWPANLQILGKDIVRFHAVYWPALLMALDLPLPEKLLVHGWIKVGDQKMSKSLGNVIDPEILFENYGADAVRFYLVRAMAITHDSPFSIDDLERHITTDLCNDLGNLLNRMITLAHKNSLYEVHAPQNWSEKSIDLRDQSWTMVQDVANYMADCSYHMALSLVWRYINAVNSYFHEHEPWKLAKSNPKLFAEVISATSHSLYTIAVLLWPIMPQKMAQLLQALGHTLQLEHNSIEHLQNNPWQQIFMLHQTPPLFEKPKEREMQPEEQKDSTPVSNDIAIDDVVKVELRVGQIVECEEMTKSEKLLKMLVDFGECGKRQILAGVKKFFSPETLINKKATFVYNLKPRKMMGLESHGMMLMAEDSDGNLKLVEIDQSVPSGTRLK